MGRAVREPAANAMRTPGADADGDDIHAAVSSGSVAFVTPPIAARSPYRKRTGGAPFVTTPHALEEKKPALSPSSPSPLPRPHPLSAGSSSQPDADEMCACACAL
ncbi:hypothetical protein B0H16DRAFT_1737269 [Mycena metata]|uniref:Uncharacterized protein n=1 Tax=Mycena metata TaxID=1033252 RepID=A0AAD7HLD8_9AGAR|nr:hypothetical protein B0H16DRAFT_1737269 [Mycena metata]